MANNEKAFMWEVTVMTLASIWSYFVHTFMQFSVGLKIVCFGWEKCWWGDGGEISTCTSFCLRDIKVMKILQVKIVANAYGRP